MDTALDDAASGSVWSSSAYWSSVVVARHGVVKTDVIVIANGRALRGLMLHIPEPAARYPIVASGLHKEPIPECALDLMSDIPVVLGLFHLFWPSLGSFFFFLFFL